MIRPVVVACGVAVLVVAALFAGTGPFRVLVVVLAAAALVDLSGLLARTGPRPVVLAAAVPGVGLPATVAAVPGSGWEAVPTFFTVSLALGFLLVLVFGRRAGATAGMAASMLASLLVGLGATGLLLLFDLPGGFRWVLGFLVLSAAAHLGAPLGGLAARRRGTGPAPAALARVAGAVAVAAVTGGVVALLLDPPFTPVATTGFVAFTLVAVLVVSDLAPVVLAEAGLGHPRPGRPARLFGHGSLLAPTAAVLLAAPPAYVVAQASLAA